MTLCSIYVPPSSVLILQELDALMDQLLSPYLLIGDFNGHKPLWGGNKRNTKGESIEDFVASHALCVLNNDYYKYLHLACGTYSAIHLSIVEPEVMLDFSWRVWDDLCGSDHFPIVLNCRGSSSVER